MLSDVIQDVRTLSYDSWTASARTWKLIGLTLLLVAFLAVLGWFITDHHETPFINLLRDPNVIADLPWYSSGLEFAGFIFLAIGVGVTSLAASLCKGQARLVLSLVALFTLVLLLDDIFMLHENSWQVGLSEKKIYASYAVFALFIMVFKVRFLSKTPVFILGLSFSFMGLSLVIDIFEDISSLIVGAEDLAELAGFAFWTTYWSTVSRQSIQRHFTTDAPDVSFDMRPGRALIGLPSES